MPAKFVLYEPLALPAAPAARIDVGDDDDWHLKNVVGLDDGDRVGAKRPLSDFQDSCHTKK